MAQTTEKWTTWKIIKMQPKKEYVVNLIVVYRCVTLNVI